MGGCLSRLRHSWARSSLVRAHARTRTHLRHYEHGAAVDRHALEQAGGAHEALAGKGGGGGKAKGQSKVRLTS